MTSLMRVFGYILAAFGALGVLSAMITLFPEGRGGMGLFVILADSLLLILPGWLLVRAAERRAAHADPEGPPTIEPEDAAGGSGRLQKWGGLTLLAVGAMIGVFGGLTAFVTEKPGVALVLLILGSVFAIPGWWLTRSGERALAANAASREARTLQKAAAEIDGDLGGSLAAAAGSAAPEHRTAIAGLLRRGRVPLDPIAAGLACCVCGIEAPLLKVELTKNTGLLIMRQQQTISGMACRPCIETNAKAFNLHNLFFGWWGLLSFFITLGAIPMNLSALSSARDLPPPDLDAEVPKLTPEVMERLEPAAGPMMEALAKGASPLVLYREAARRYGVTPAQVLLHVAWVAARCG